MRLRLLLGMVAAVCLAVCLAPGCRNDSATLAGSSAASGTGNETMNNETTGGDLDNGSSQRVVRSDEEWRAMLTAEQYYVARAKGTERAFSGEYWDTKTPGVYHCVCCDAPLFSSDTKYESGTGWPSFFAPLSEDELKLETDYKLFWPRTEVLCRRCDAHLGHVFDDGPEPTGLRYCLNSAALRLSEAEGAAAAREENRQ